MQPFYLIVRTYLQLLVVAGLVQHFLLTGNLALGPIAPSSQTTFKLRHFQPNSQALTR